MATISTSGSRIAHPYERPKFGAIWSWSDAPHRLLAIGTDGQTTKYGYEYWFWDISRSRLTRYIVGYATDKWNIHDEGD